MANLFKKDRSRIRIRMLLTAEKGICGGIYHAIHRYAKANNKYMKNYDKNIRSSYLVYLDANNICGWGMSQKFPVKLLKFNEDFVKNYNEYNNKRYILEVDAEYPKDLFSPHKIFHF